MFCDDCGSMMHSRGGEMVCSSCGARRSKDADRGDELVTTEAQSDDDVIESSPDADFEGKPTADDVTCDDCGHGEAWYTIKQNKENDSY
ncbi:transcription factor S [Halobacteriales archaeon QS_8_69_73]|nr:MAG: transcription factor S [Halobacteriales archaeon QS_8_69_73]